MTYLWLNSGDLKAQIKTISSVLSRTICRLSKINTHAAADLSDLSFAPVNKAVSHCAKFTGYG